MTSADDFVLQLLIDKAIVDSDAIDAARSKVAEDQIDGDPDSAALDVLIAEHAVTQMQIAKALAEEFSMEVVDLADVRASSEALDVITYDLANRYKVFPLEVDDAEVELSTWMRSTV